jgi:hypothetical protein
MSILIPATPRSTTANSYLTVADADTYFETRLYTTAWDNAAATPDAEGYTVVNDDGHTNNENLEGETTAVVNGGVGTGTFTVGTKIRFSSHTTTYTVTGTSTPGAANLLHLALSPALSQDINVGETVERLTANTKEKALIQATSMLDEYFNWFGTILDEDQRLGFPRSSAYDREGNSYDREEIPRELKDATCEMALRLLQGDSMTEPSLTTQGFSEVTLGPINVKVDTSNKDDVVADTVVSMVSHLGAPTAYANRGTKVVPLWRS